MENYFHSVRLDAQKCQGCVTCIRLCPTEAIRVRQGKAKIAESWCIDCGECIRNCPAHAKLAVTDSLADLAKYKYNIALPAPSLYAQFSLKITIERILAGLLSLGFDNIFEVAEGAEIVSLAVQDYLENEKNILKPVISSACPAVVRLIQVKYPELIEHLSPFDPPVEVAARVARAQANQKTGISPDEIGTWFITPCPAKMTSARTPLGIEKSHVSGAIAINKIYGLLRKAISELPPEQINLRQASWLGVGWAVSGGESVAVKAEAPLVVDNIHNVIDVLEQIFLGKFKKINHVEALACDGGCTGGALMIENRHVAEYRLRERVKHKMEAEREEPAIVCQYPVEPLGLAEKRPPIEPKSILPLDENMTKAIQKLDNVSKTLKELPGLDCGSCGSPSCKSLAEDIVQGQAAETDCVFILRKRVGELAQEMVNLSSKLPPPLDKDDDN